MSDHEWHVGEPERGAGGGEPEREAGRAEPEREAGGAEPPLMHDGIPITGYFRGEPIPDLNALPQERWLEVLRPLSHWPRTHATAAVRTVEQASAALRIKGQLLLEDGPPPRARPIEGALARILTVRGVECALNEERGQQ